MSDKCKSCGAPVIWCVTTTGGKMPVDAQPAEGGNLEVKETPSGAACTNVKKDERAGKQLHKSHFVTCPSASQHRKGK